MGTRKRILNWLLKPLIIPLLLAHTTAAWSQVDQEISNVTSRELTIFNGFTAPVSREIKQVYSREATIFNGFTAPVAREIVDLHSREFTIFNGFTRPAEREITTIVSRELTIYSPLADLAVTAITATPGEGLPGTGFTLLWKVTNTGGGTALGSWTDRVSLSSDAEPGNDILLGEVPQSGPLTPGASYDETLALQFPEEPGPYWLIVVSDHANALGEINRLNNTVVDDRSLIVLRPLAPDLVVSEVEGPTAAVLSGSSTEISFTVTNQSDNPTNVRSWQDSVFLTFERELSGNLRNEILLGQFDNPMVLPAGESYRQTVLVNMPPENLQSTVYLAVYADSRRASTGRLGDPFDQVEANEINNFAFSPVFELTISPVQPDLVVSELSFAPDAFSARSLPISWNASNIGTGSTGSGHWISKVFLSRNQDAEISIDDLLLGQHVRADLPLAAGVAEPQTLSTVLPVELGGAFFVKVSIDTMNEIDEFGGEDNNITVSAQPVTVLSSQPLDLWPAALTVSKDGFPGHEIIVTWSVENIGAPPLDLSSFWRDTIYLSADASFDPAEDIRLGVTFHSTSRDDDGKLIMPPYEKEIRPRLPDQLEVADYHVFLVVDAADQVYEGPADGPENLGEKNNVLVSDPVSVHLSAADLALELLPAEPPPTAAAAGQEISLTWRVENIGELDTPVSSWVDRVYLSSDGVLDFVGEHLMTTSSRNIFLARDASYTTRLQARAPLVPAGDYVLIFVADATDRVLEPPAGEENNLASAPFTVTGAAADLVVVDLDVPDTAAPGEEFIITWRTENRGTLRTNRNFWIDRVYLSGDADFDAGDYLLGRRSQADFLDPDTGISTAASFIVPLELAGLFHVIVVCDASNEVFESNDLNNLAITEMVVAIDQLPAPRLVVSSVDITGAISSGQTIEVAWTVTNEGAGPTTVASWHDSLFLSRNRTLERDEDLFIGAVEHRGILGHEPPENSYDAAGRFDIPLGVSGPFFVLVVAASGSTNAGEVIIDFDEDLIDVELPPPGDMIVESIATDETGILGEATLIEYRIKNNGSTTVTGRWQDALFLSTDTQFDLEDELLGIFTSVLEAPLAPSQSATFSVQPIPGGVIPGDYHVLVRTDVKPWLEANLTSDKLDLDGLAKFRPTAAAGDASGGTLSALKKLQNSRITLNAKSLRAAEILLREVNLAVVSGSNTIDIEQLDFSLDQGRLTSSGDLSWLKDTATLSLEAQVKNVSLDKFLTDAPSMASTPLSGTVSLRSSGDTVSGLLAGLTGDIHLNTSPDGSNAASAAGAQIDMTARQTANGMHAEIHRFQWEGTDLSGSLEYHKTTPPMLEVEFGGGSLSLLPWEETAADHSKKDAEEPDSSIISDTAKASAGMIGRVLTAPLKLISGPREAEPGEKVFSDTILPFDSLKQYQATIKGRLDTLTSLEAIASDLTFSASLLEGKFDAQASAGTFNGGSGSLKINIDAAQTPASVGLSGTFKNLRGPQTTASIPRSGYFTMTSSGSSQAELAGSVDGLAYLELGQGPLDYGNLMLLTADVATSVFQALIPDADKKSQQLECGLTLGVFEDGIGTTPYGYAARTKHANLVGKIEVDLKREMLHLNFSSSSRRGVGLSVGNVFSNTVEVEGPLTDPRVIPNATGLAWRSWAAVMTAGLSVVGESVLKRALASEDPCLAVQKHIRKDYCGAGGLGGASPMVCPPA